LRFFKKTGMLPRIAAPALTKPDNPYRQILRRSVPEPVLALLMFFMGVYLWMNHFPEQEGRYGDDAWQMALIKIDRDLRIAETTEQFPPLARKLLGISDLETTLNTSVRSLAILASEKVGTDDPSSLEGAYALAILDAIRHGGDPVRGPFVDPRLPGPPDPRHIIKRVAEGRDRWWDRRYLLAFGERGSPEIGLKPETVEEDSRNRELVLRVLSARGSVALFALVGLFFLPRTLRAFGRAMGSRAPGYVGHWPMSVGLGIFFMAYLASIGFSMLLTLLIAGQFTGGRAIPLPPPVFALLEAGTRMLPAFVVLSYLFRKLGHAGGRLGLFAKPDPFIVLGSFSILTALDYGLRIALAHRMQLDPTGGLSGDDGGWWGLTLVLVSACLAAPVAEEILYRGVLFRSMANRIRVPAATLLSAAVFAAVHFYDAYGLLSVAAVGVTCSLCFAATGRLATAILLHVLYNFAIKVPEWIVYHAPL
jgi:membrane protease YdiL (CAAX protease family)